jgi:hypothetical protein
MNDTLIAQLDRLAELQAELEAYRMKYDEEEKAILVQVDAQLMALQEKYGPELAQKQQDYDNLSGEIKAHVIAVGESVKGKYLHAVYSKPRVSWDTTGLDGYAVAHPEVLAFKSFGQPSVSIRDVK